MVFKMWIFVNICTALLCCFNIGIFAVNLINSDCFREIWAVVVIFYTSLVMKKAVNDLFDLC